jgi:hypothetical protein
VTVGIQSFGYVAPLLPINLVLVSASASPSLTYNFETLPIVGDVVQWFDGVTSLGTHTITQTDINNGTLSGSLTPLASGARVIKVTQTRGPQVGASNTVSFTV